MADGEAMLNNPAGKWLAERLAVGETMAERCFSEALFEWEREFWSSQLKLFREAIRAQGDLVQTALKSSAPGQQ